MLSPRLAWSTQKIAGNQGYPVSKNKKKKVLVKFYWTRWQMLLIKALVRQRQADLSSKLAIIIFNYR